MSDADGNDWQLKDDLLAIGGWCVGVWHGTTPRESACPLCGETGSGT